jgi:hypothetical protein
MPTRTAAWQVALEMFIDSNICTSAVLGLFCASHILVLISCLPEPC